jgi:hypothetical protein
LRWSWTVQCERKRRSASASAPEVEYLLGWREPGRPRCATTPQRQLGHANLGITSVYLKGIDNAEIIATVHARRVPVIPASAGLRAML